jgi:NADPH2:quinone reductase
MKAVVVRGFTTVDKIDIGELPDPKPGASELVIDVAAAEVNYPDVLVITGDYQFKPPLPFAPGKAAAGVVSAIGDNVAGFVIGDRVCAEVEYGAYAQKLLAPAVNVFHIPDGITFTTAAALGLVYQTSHFALVERAQLQPGENVLVLGAGGGVGGASIQLAKALDAGRVIGGARGASKVEVARGAGADLVLDLASFDLRDGLREAVRAVTDGRGADVIIDPIGGAVSSAAVRALAWRGRMVIVGFAAGEIPTFKANYLLVKNITISGLQWSDYRDRAPDWIRRVQDEIFQLHLAGKLNPLISRIYPLDDFKEALALIRDGKVQGKLILEITS